MELISKLTYPSRITEHMRLHCLCIVQGMIDKSPADLTDPCGVSLQALMTGTPGFFGF